jgi:hypothetical protein
MYQLYRFRYRGIQQLYQLLFLIPLLTTKDSVDQITLILWHQICSLKVDGNKKLRGSG